MSTNHALGTVAIVTNKYGVSHPAIRTFDPNRSGRLDVWRPGIADVFYADSDVTDVRPMLLVDPEDPEALAAALKEAAGSTAFTIRGESGKAIDDGRWDFTNAFAVAVLQHLADPTPPEPKGLGAVVESFEGSVWVRGHHNNKQPWVRTAFGEHRGWDEIPTPPTVLHEGYTPEAQS